MGELNFNNFDFSKLRTGMNIGNDNIFLKKYDKDGNSIFDAEELLSFEDIYLLENGVEFNPENIQNYEHQTQITNAIMMLNNQILFDKLFN